MDFAKKYKEFFVGLASKIFALFIRELFKLIKKDIVKLIKSLQADVKKANASKEAEIILALLALGLLLLFAESSAVATFIYPIF